MIATITLNPSIDVTYILKNFEIGKVIRSKSPLKMPAGKGINTGRTLSLLGENVIAYTFLAGSSGSWIKKELQAENFLQLKTINIQGESRTSTTIMSGEGIQTQIVEDGPTVNKENLDDLFELLIKDQEELSMIIISGSVTSKDKFIYSNLIKFIRNNFNKKIPIFLDASSSQLSTVIFQSEYKPDFIKPNEDELSELLGKKLSKKETILSELKKETFHEIPYILVSLGENGGIAKMNDNFYDIKIPKISVINTTGSGDATVGGFAYALEKKYDSRKILKYAMACGMSNALHEKVGFIEPDEIEKFIDEIKVEELS